MQELQEAIDFYVANIIIFFHNRLVVQNYSITAKNPNDSTAKISHHKTRIIRNLH